MTSEERHTTLKASFHKPPDSEIARLEAENGLKQYDRISEIIAFYTDVENERVFRLRPSLLLDLQRIAVEGTTPDPGVYRSGRVEIHGSRHVPPDAHLVPELVERFCETINDKWDSWSSLRLGAFSLWKLNWIHPFSDGNGRTSRATSYIIMSVKLGYHLPGTPSIPEQISDDKKPYYEALEQADASVSGAGDNADAIDLSEMEKLLEDRLAKQLLSVVHKAKR